MQYFSDGLILVVLVRAFLRISSSLISNSSMQRYEAFVLSLHKPVLAKNLFGTTLPIVGNTIKVIIVLDVCGLLNGSSLYDYH